ncbi:peptide transporter family 1-like isoform X1 [Hydractinia symbiolongicarpus]|uniref:peptide transporter family 1-like isoform X1 n=1 Tax=Hydractinia symbiolongicarpus TaxID=13093 RepID=UPI00254F32A4|nr:peptide transporter family 1-like isoform X1 [Hydractinia symbiolongicarpus]
MTKSENGKVQYNASNEDVVIDEGETFNDACLPQLLRLPKQTWPILNAELCERFSYYGIKTVLVIYLTKSLMMSDSDGKAYYHAFSMVSYFTGVLGAMMADSFLGKYKTIIWSLVLYSISEIVLTLTTIPSIGKGNSAGPLIGLFATAVACGNIKPCMAAFGGDQFNQKDTGLISTFFSLFYMSVNVGAMLTMIFVPMIRTDIKCYGSDCYPVVFGVNCIVIILATVSLFLGSPFYVKKEPEGSIMIRVFKIIGHALSRKMKSSEETYHHWLYYAQDKYDKTEIDDVKSLMKVLVMYLPLPVFWALFHQQGSSWTLQATQMDGDFGGGVMLRSDQIQFFNPVLVLILIPAFNIVIYPMFERCRLGLSPLKKMVGGMLLAAVAFAITGFMQIKIQDVQSPPPAPPATMTSVDFINVSPCEVIELNPSSFLKISLPYGQNTGHKIGQSGNRTFKVKGTNCFKKVDFYTNEVTVSLKAGARQTVLLDIADDGMMESTVVDHLFPAVSVTKAHTRVRTFYVPSGNMSDLVHLTYDHVIEKKDSVVVKNFTSYNGTYDFILADEYQLLVRPWNSQNGYNIKLPSENLKLGTFGAYTITLKRPKHQKYSRDLVAHLYEDVDSTSVHRLWQLPQYVVITAGEVMFSVTGLEFAYSQAPPSMKSVLQACWLLTTAFGDLLVVILSVAKPVDGVEKEMFLYGGIMLVVAFIFAVMSYFYTYSDFSGNITTNPADEKEIEESKLNSADSTTHL